MKEEAAKKATAVQARDTQSAGELRRNSEQVRAATRHWELSQQVRQIVRHIKEPELRTGNGNGEGDGDGDATGCFP